MCVCVCVCVCANWHYQVLFSLLRVQNLLSTLQKVQSAQKSAPDEDQSKKLDELYDLVKKWDAERELLPDLVRCALQQETTQSQCCFL